MARQRRLFLFSNETEALEQGLSCTPSDDFMSVCDAAQPGNEQPSSDDVLLLYFSPFAHILRTESESTLYEITAGACAVCARAFRAGAKIALFGLSTDCFAAVSRAQPSVLYPSLRLEKLRKFVEFQERLIGIVPPGTAVIRGGFLLARTGGLDSLLGCLGDFSEEGASHSSDVEEGSCWGSIQAIVEELSLLSPCPSLPFTSIDDVLRAVFAENPRSSSAVSFECRLRLVFEVAGEVLEEVVKRIQVGQAREEKKEEEEEEEKAKKRLKNFLSRKAARAKAIASLLPETSGRLQCGDDPLSEREEDNREERASTTASKDSSPAEVPRARRAGKREMEEQKDRSRRKLSQVLRSLLQQPITELVARHDDSAVPFSSLVRTPSPSLRLFTLSSPTRGQARTSFQYRPRRILLTGGAGFIGSHVCNYLVSQYPHYLVVNFDLLDYCSSLHNVEESVTAPNYRFVKGDIRNLAMVEYVMSSLEIDTVLHFAAQSHVDVSFGNSIDFTTTNVVGTHVLLEASRRVGVSRFIHVSTDEVYGDMAHDAKEAGEGSVLDPTNPYASSKAAAEFIVKSYVKSYNLPVIVSRGNNVFGPKQFPEKVIPKFILRLLQGKKCCIHGNGTAKRSYVYVSDVVSAFDLILHKGETGCTYNIASDDEVSILNLAKSLIQIVREKSDASIESGDTRALNYDQFVEFVEDRRINDRRYAVDGSRLYALGWKQRVGFLEGLAKTVDWYRELKEEYWKNVDASLRPHPSFAAESVI